MLHTYCVPVKPHVLKYLLLHLSGQYRLSQVDPYGRHLKMLLQQKRQNKFLDGFTGKYTAKFNVLVIGNMLIQKRLKDLTSKDVIDFNNFVEGIIKAEFHSMVATRTDFGLSQYAAIQAFRAKYDFQDEDLSHDTLKKSWQRYAEQNPHLVRRPKAVSVCPPPAQRLAA